MPKVMTIDQVMSIKKTHSEFESLLTRSYSLPWKNIADSLRKIKAEMEMLESGNEGATSIDSIVMVLHDQRNHLSLLLDDNGKFIISDDQVDDVIRDDPREWSEKPRAAIRDSATAECEKCRSMLVSLLQRAETLQASLPMLKRHAERAAAIYAENDTPEAAALQAELAECLKKRDAMIKKGHRFLSSEANRYEGEILARRIVTLQTALGPRYQP